MRAKTKKAKTNFFIPSIVYVLIFGLLVKIFLAFFGTLQLDQGTFVAWGNLLVKEGFKNFYNNWSDYLPGYMYILWGLGKLTLTNILPEALLFKLPAIFSDLFTGFLIYKILAKSKGEKWGIWGLIIYIINPAILANSSLWGQVDSFSALTSILSIYLLPINYFGSAVSLALGTLIKPQVAFVFPVIFLVMLKERWNFKKIFLYIISGLGVFTALFIPFWNHGNLIAFIYERLGISLGQYPFSSVNAFNLWGLFGFWKPDNIFFQFAGYLLVIVLLLVLFFKSLKNRHVEYLLTAFVFAASFVLFTRMHERHLLPVFAPLAIVAIENPAYLIPYIGFSITYIANLYYSYVWITEDFRQIFSDMLVKFLSFINIFLVGFIFYSVINEIKIKWGVFIKTIRKLIKARPKIIVKSSLPKLSISSKSSKVILFAILIFAFITRTYKLNSPTEMYFDEVYHAFTAKTMMGADAAKAWEWWNTPPEGFAYEWTHPPLAKLGMVLGMKIFGQNPFGWRILGALLGVSSVFLTYLLAKEIFKDETTGLISAFVFSLDGLALVMSRIGMNDSYLLFFTLLSIYLFMKQKDLPSAISYGLALASKWSTLWAAPILFILWLKRKDKSKISTYIYFILIPFAIYLLSYLPMFFTGHNLSIWWGMQKQMWWYHTGLKATHSYSSPWWSWPFLVRPIYLYTSEEIRGVVSRIYAMGNPFVFWFGMVSVAFGAIYSYLERNKKIGFVIFCYLIFFVPWALSPRIMFLYHYLPSVPFLAIATGYLLRRNLKLVPYVLPLMLLAFIYFYPHWVGLQIPIWLDKSYYWMSSWR